MPRDVSYSARYTCVASYSGTLRVFRKYLFYGMDQDYDNDDNNDDDDD